MLKNLNHKNKKFLELVSLKTKIAIYDGKHLKFLGFGLMTLFSIYGIVDKHIPVLIPILPGLLAIQLGMVMAIGIKLLKGGLAFELKEEVEPLQKEYFELKVIQDIKDEKSKLNNTLPNHSLDTGSLFSLLNPIQNTSQDSINKKKKINNKVNKI